MKHIFKKLHHHPNRSNETPQQPPPPPPPQSSSCSTDARPASSSSPTPTATAAVTDANPQHLHPSQDYYASVEEFEVQLAMALSVSSSGQDSTLVDSDKTPIRTSDYPNGAADVLSRRYWNFGFLDFEERVVDGFYDVYNLSSDAASRGDMPSLTDLESDNGGSNYEVVIVNRKIDPALEELMQIAHCIALDRPTTEVSLLIQRLADLVIGHLGGPVRDANIVLAKWMDRSIELRTSLHTIVLPIGSLKIGLSRHRALLFKALADSVGIPCRLVKGSHYTGFEDDAINIIKLQDDSEYFVDLMGAPGTLIPSDVLNGKDTPESSKFPSLQTTMDTKVSSTQHGQVLGGHNLSLEATSSKIEPQFGARANDGVGTSGLNKKVPPANLLDHNIPQAIGSSLYKGGNGSNFAGDGVRINVNVTPYISEDSGNLFAELNPFQMKESGKSVVKNDQAGKMQFPRNNTVSNRPPAPLMWKNHRASNNIPTGNQFDYGKGLFPSNNQVANKISPSSGIERNSKIPPKASRLPENVSNKPGVDALSTLSSNDSYSTSYESGSSTLSIHGKETYHREGRDVIKSEAVNSESLKTNMPGLPMDKRNMQDGFIRTNMEPRKAEGASSSSNLRHRYADTEIDDVVECEIAWEDLDLGERIGLGSYGEVYHADWNGTEVAVKKFLDQDFSGAALDEFKREVRIMRRLLIQM